MSNQKSILFHRVIDKLSCKPLFYIWKKKSRNQEKEEYLENTDVQGIVVQILVKEKNTDIRTDILTFAYPNKKKRNNNTK